MIASLGAIGLGTGLGGSSNRSTPPPIEEETTPTALTPTGLETFSRAASTIDTTQPHKAVLETNKGKIEIQLATDTPEAVNSFAFLAGKGFYNGTIFFYVQKDFVAQAGDPTCSVNGANACSGLGGPGYTLPVEKTAATHDQWAVVAPATLEGQSVHGSQFRILFQPDPREDGKETVFGRVVAGQEILQSLSDFVPCSVSASVSGCVANPDPSSALVIEKVTVQPT